MTETENFDVLPVGQMRNADHAQINETFLNHSQLNMTGSKLQTVTFSTKRNLQRKKKKKIITWSFHGNFNFTKNVTTR